jgi:hypothetical protein
VPASGRECVASGADASEPASFVSELAEVAARLYDLTPEEFTAARNEAVAAARKAGDRELAKDIAALRRPTVGAWMVNLLAHRRPDLIGELLELGAALRAAQRNLRGDDLRELSTNRRAMISALARESRALAVAAGRDSATLPVPEVESTLTAALADDDVAELVRLGQLSRPVEYAGFGEQPRPQLRLVHGGAGDAPAKEQPAEPTTAERKAAQREQAAREAAQREAAHAEREVAQERALARQRAAEQRQRQQAAHRELLAARTALATAEAKRTEAERVVREARRRVEAALTEVEASRTDNA